MIRNADVEQEELLRHDQAAVLRASPRGQAEAEVRVFEDFKVGADDLGGDARFARDVGVVEQLAARERRDAQELRERGQVLHERFGGDLFAQVVAEVGAQLFARLARQEVRWQKARSQRAFEVELAQLAAQKRHELPAPRAARGQVRVAAPPLACAGAREQEREAGVSG
jgi:hypothetical protein